jgi:peptidoglycan hydrolase-like protein with peptidoglycan-binding domain
VTATRRTRVALVAGCLVAVLGAGGIAVVAMQTPVPSAADTRTDRATAPVVRGDLTERTTYAGTLGFGAARPFSAAASGTITWLPTAGTVVGRDGELVRVDDRPIRAMIGGVPVFRELTSGLRGPDVRQLNENLAALGYGVPADDRFGSGTLTAVRRWQKDRGLPVTGRLGTSDIAFLPGSIRVADVTGAVGDPAGGPAFQYTSDQRVVTFTVPATDADRVAVGARVDVTINGIGDPIPGAVTSVAPGTADGKDVVTGTVTLDPTDHAVPNAGSALVRVGGQTRKGVLSVPIVGLKPGARADEYVVEVLRPDGSVRRVPVTPGLVADGRVEVSGKLAAGDRVVVPS